MVRYLIFLCCTLLLFVVTSARAQISAALDAAGTRVKFSGDDGSSVWSLAPSLRWDTPRGSLLAQASWARFTEGTWSAQGAVGASHYWSSAVGLQLELGGTAAWTLQEGGSGTGRLSAATRLHYAKARAGVWSGGALGRAHDGRTARTIIAGEGGMWVRVGAAALAISAVPTWIADSLRHTDVLGALHVERGPLDASVSAGWRSWSQPGAAPDATWASATAALWLSRHLAMVAGAGTYPVDWAQGLPSGQFVTLSLRLATRRPVEHREVGYRLLPPGVMPVVPAFDVVDSGDGRRIMRVYAPAATRVEIMGDFTLWKPVPLEPGADGRWSATFALSRGVYRMNLRVNGGAWGVPPGVPVLRDEFSGAVGVLVID